MCPNNTLEKFSCLCHKTKWKNTQVSLKIFHLPRFTLANLFKLVFHNSAWNSLHLNYLYILKIMDFIELRSNPLQATPAYSRPLQPTPIHSRRTLSNYPPTHSRPLQPTLIHSRPLQATPTHSNPLQPTPGHSDQLQPTPDHSDHLKPLEPTPCRFNSLQPTPSTPNYTRNTTTRYSKPFLTP